MGVIRDVRRVARKKHTCYFCSGDIHPGETYISQTLTDEGDIHTLKTHISCTNLASNLKWYEDFPDGLSDSDFMDNVQEEYRDLQIKLNKDTKNYPCFKEQLIFIKNYYSKIHK